MNWKQILRKWSTKATHEQLEVKRRLVEAFRLMWKSNPSEKEFTHYTSGLVLFPESVYIMCKESQGGEGDE